MATARTIGQWRIQRAGYNNAQTAPTWKYLDMHISPAAERVRERCFWKLPASCHPTLSISALHLGRALLKDCKIALTPITLRQYSRPLHPESYGTSTRGKLLVSRALPPSQPMSPSPTAPLQRQSYDLRAGHKPEKKRTIPGTAEEREVHRYSASLRLNYRHGVIALDAWHLVKQNRERGSQKLQEKHKTQANQTLFKVSQPPSCSPSLDKATQSHVGSSARDKGSV
ncbi:hypothetical protein OIDMADRAFT_32463 [Oidiodendron maius Zn]|uniref:Uncharacterized protein n=1 Tax=Oidiodendron maius (strain Zn) TaxID=913774 RepID=A0A0C3CEW1_OIDMZ|nr:hypothetical protein OIDMADRAFT_32463 [Oidiodendron maius Zn]